MAGGHGEVSTTDQSRRIEKIVAECRNELICELCPCHPTLICQKWEGKYKLRYEQIPGGIGSCEPDGGPWFFRNELIATFEAKHQGDEGNAVERIYKNNVICREINPNVSCVSFITGLGADPKPRYHLPPGQRWAIMVKILAVDHQGNRGSFDQYDPGKNSCFRSVNGFPKAFIKDAMRKVILERIANANEEHYDQTTFHVGRWEEQDAQALQAIPTPGTLF